MLKETIVERLNAQINLEFYSSVLYLQMSSWCESKGLGGCSGFLRRHAAEEMEHMHRLFGYVNETGAMVKIGAIEAPPEDFKDVTEVFRQTLAHEIEVTQSINELVAATFEAKDYSTFQFLQWYVAEQHEEERLFRGILDKIELIDLSGRGLFLFDKEIEALDVAPAAEA